MGKAQEMVELWRGGLLESTHRGHAVVCDETGQIVAAWGDPDRVIFPRSSAKMMQALPLVESGAADAFGLTPRQLSLSCASHEGSALHVGAAREWLAGLGLGDSDLRCGAHEPSNRAERDRLIRAHERPCQLHNNCSGKHCGFLTTARALGEETVGYIGRDHPVQRRVAQALGEMMGLDMAAVPWAVDGCGIPSFAVPLSAIAAGMARLGDPSRLGNARAAACGRIRAAMRAHPDLVAGTGRSCTLLMRTVPDVVVKAGAEGVYAAALPRLGLGVALKIEDGSGRAAEVAMVALLGHLGALDDNARTALAERVRVPLRNVAGRIVGVIRPAPTWLGD